MSKLIILDAAAQNRIPDVLFYLGNDFKDVDKSKTLILCKKANIPIKDHSSVTNDECSNLMQHTLLSYLWTMYVDKCLQIRNSPDVSRAKYQQLLSKVIVTEEEQLVILQLCLADLNKKWGIDDVALSDIYLAHEHIVRHKLDSPAAPATPKEEQQIVEEYGRFMKQCKLLDSVDLFKAALQETGNDGGGGDNNTLLLTHWPDTSLQTKLLMKYCETRDVKVTRVTASVGGEEEEGVESGNVGLSSEVIGSVDELRGLCGSEQRPCGSATPHTPHSDTQDYITSVMLCYLRILLNTRDELALTITFNVPDRGLGHHVFTGIKHLATHTHLTLCQTVMSYVRRVELYSVGTGAGGGCVACIGSCEYPEQHSILASHTTSLNDWYSLYQTCLNYTIDMQQQPVECLTKILNTLRLSFVKHSDNMNFKCDSIQRSAGKLLSRAKALHSLYSAEFKDMSSTELCWLLVTYSSVCGGGGGGVAGGSSLCFSLTDRSLHLTPTPRRTATSVTTPGLTTSHHSSQTPRRPIQLQCVLSKHRTPDPAASPGTESPAPETDSCSGRLSLEQRVMCDLGLPADGGPQRQQQASVGVQQQQQRSECQYWAVDEDSMTLDDDVKQSIQAYNRARRVLADVEENETAAGAAESVESSKSSKTGGNDGEDSQQPKRRKKKQTENAAGGAEHKKRKSSCREPAAAGGEADGDTKGKARAAAAATSARGGKKASRKGQQPLLSGQRSLLNYFQKQ